LSKQQEIIKQNTENNFFMDPLMTLAGPMATQN